MMQDLMECVVMAAADYDSMKDGHTGLGGFNVAMARRMERIAQALEVSDAEAQTVGLRITEAPEEVAQ
jgi:hypothetical protein